MLPIPTMKMPIKMMIMLSQSFTVDSMSQSSGSLVGLHKCSESPVTLALREANNKGQVQHKYDLGQKCQSDIASQCNDGHYSAYL